MKSILIKDTTKEEREEIIRSSLDCGGYSCIADCDMCGLCTVFRGKDAETAYDDYIRGVRSFAEVSGDYKR